MLVFASFRSLGWAAMLGGVAVLVFPAESSQGQPLRQREGNFSSPSGRLDPGIIGGQAFGARGRNQSTGVLITSVLPGSPAQLAGLEVRDLVVTVDGYQVGTVNGRTFDLEQEVVRRALPRGSVTLLVRDWRSGELRNIQADLRSTGPPRPPRPPVIGGPGRPQMDQIRGWYDRYLERDPTASEMVGWRDSILQGTMTVDNIEAYLLGSREFYDRIGRGSDLSFITALIRKTEGRQPTLPEVNRWLAELRRQPGGRVAFVERYLQSNDSSVPPGIPTASTGAVRASLSRYQRQMAAFVTWGYYGQQSQLVYQSSSALRQIDQYDTQGFGGAADQLRLARTVESNADQLIELSGKILEKAKQTGRQVRESRALRDDAIALRDAARQLVRELNR